MAVQEFLKAAKDIQQDTTSKPDKGPRKVSEDESNWLVSYADMMTLLCGFFIMLFSMATLSKPKYEAATKEIAEHFGSPKQDDTQSQPAVMVQEMKKVIHESVLDRDVKVTHTHEGISIVFESSVLFNSLSAYVRTDGRNMLRKIIGVIKTGQSRDKQDYKIVVEGHTDAQPILGGIYPSNWELSSARATRVVRMFLDDGFNASKLLAIGYADARPEVDNRKSDGTWDDAALNKNRRVVIHVYDPSVETIPWDSTPAPAIAAASVPAASAAPAAAPVREPASANPAH